MASSFTGQTLLISPRLSVCLSVSLWIWQLNLKESAVFDSGVGGFGWYLPVSSLPRSLWVMAVSWLCNVADWQLWLVNPSLSLISPSWTPQLRGNCRGSDRASGYYCQGDTELYLLVRIETSQLSSFHTLKFQFWTVKGDLLFCSADWICCDKMAICSFISELALCRPQ